MEFSGKKVETHGDGDGLSHGCGIHEEEEEEEELKKETTRETMEA